MVIRGKTYDTRERTGDDGNTTQMPWLQSGVLTGRAFTVVPVTDDDPANTLLLVISGNSWNGVEFTVGEVLDLVGFTVGLIDGTNKHVVRDVVQVTTVLQPRTGHGDVVSGSLALGLDQNWKIGSVLAIPSGEWLEKLQAVGGGRDGDLDRRTVLGWMLVGLHAWIVPIGRKTVTTGCLELELLAVLVLEGVSQRVEIEGTGDGHRYDKIWRGNESVGGRVCIVAASEVTVVGGDNRVGCALGDVLAVPLTCFERQCIVRSGNGGLNTDARSTGVGKDHTTKVLKSLELTIALNGGANLLGTGGDSEDGLGLDSVVHGVLGDGCGARHVLVRGVCARSNQTDLEVSRPVVVCDGLLELADRSGKIWGKWAVDVRLKLREVDLDKLVVFCTLVFTELLGV